MLGRRVRRIERHLAGRRQQPELRRRIERRLAARPLVPAELGDLRVRQHRELHVGRLAGIDHPAASAALVGPPLIASSAAFTAADLRRIGRRRVGPRHRQLERIAHLARAAHRRPSAPRSTSITGCLSSLDGTSVERSCVVARHLHHARSPGRWRPTGSGSSSSLVPAASPCSWPAEMRQRAVGADHRRPLLGGRGIRVAEHRRIELALEQRRRLQPVLRRIVGEHALRQLPVGHGSGSWRAPRRSCR